MFRTIDSAPRDGTVIELQINAGFRPWYGLHRWDGDRWVNATDPSSSLVSESNVCWRPYAGDPDHYIDATGGAQFTYRYWGVPRDGVFTEQNETEEQKPRWWERLLP
jgi:hypothetical protein